MKRYTIVTVILVLTALLAAGCRGGGNPPTTLPTTMPTTAPTTQATTQPTTGTGLPGDESIGSSSGDSEPTGQNSARGAMPRGF